MVPNFPYLPLVCDWWHPDGILYEKYGCRVIYNDATSMDAKLSNEMRNNGDQRWKPAKSNEIVAIQNKLRLVEIGGENQPMWLLSQTGKFNFAMTWCDVRLKKPEISWRKLTWFPIATSKHDFIGWVVFKKNTSPS